MLFTNQLKVPSSLFLQCPRKTLQLTLPLQVRYYPFLQPTVVFSSNVVEVEKLEDSRNAVLSGKWTDKTAGGCHLYDKEFEQKTEKFTWTSNPKFHMRL